MSTYFYRSGLGEPAFRRRAAKRSSVTRLKPSAKRPGGVFWMTYWLAIVCIIAKLSHFDRPAAWNPQALRDYAWDAIIATAADNFFVTCLGLLAAISLVLAPSRGILRTLLRGTWSILFLLCAFYAVVSAYEFSFTHTPLTRGLLKAAGDWSNLKSSVAAFVHRGSIAALMCGSLGYLLLSWICWRLIGIPRSRFAGSVIGALVVMSAGQYAYARHAEPQWNRRADHRIALSPHWALFSSEVFNAEEHPLKFPANVPVDYDAEFRPLRERGAEAMAPVSPFPGKPKHVIVYVLESTGTQMLHLYGSPYATTPCLDAEASDSLVFDNMYCHVGMTSRSLVAINSSNFARTVWQEPYVQEHPLNQPGILLSTVLKEKSFRTLALTSSDFEYAHQLAFLQDRGFDQIWDKRNMPGKELISWGKTDALMVDTLLKWIDDDAAHSTPFFAMCWTNQTHHPYAMTPDVKEVDMLGEHIPPAPADPVAINRYLNILLDEDRQLGRLFAGLRERGLADDTLVVITGDHGEGFNFPHDTLGHGIRVFEENVRVPCIFWNPSLFHHARRNSTISSHIDLAPSITDLFGIAPAPTWQGYSLFRAGHPDRAFFYGAYADHYLAMRSGDWKYTFNATTGYDELYNLALDPKESKDVSAVNGEVCKDLRLRVSAWAKYLDQHGAGVKP